jgi:hypothetical protein
MAKRQRQIIIHFTDGTRINVLFPVQGGDTPAQMAATVRKALALDKLAIEADGSLLVIPTRNIKYMKVYPCPEALPDGEVIRGATVND